MQNKDYNDFYDTVIKKCIDRIIENAESNECDYKESRCKRSIYKHYQIKRDYIKDKYMQKTAEAALDRHKVAACMMYAILKVRPIKVNRYIWRLPEKILLANEYLAFYVALNIIEMYKKDELKEKLNSKDVKYEIIAPKTYHEGKDSTFESNTCRALYYIRLRGIERFDIFAYSSILFMLEKYTDTIYEND